MVFHSKINNQQHCIQYIGIIQLSALYCINSRVRRLMCCVLEGFVRVFTSSVQFSSVAQLYPTLCDHMNYSTPGLPVHHQLPEFTQTHTYRVSDAIQPCQLCRPFSPCPQSLPVSGSFPMIQLFASGGQRIAVSASTSVLPMNTQD